MKPQKFVIKCQFSKHDVRYFVGFDCDEEDWTMFIDSASRYSLKEARAVAEINGFDDANVYSIVPLD